jgi:hypothetical protein
MMTTVTTKWTTVAIVGYTGSVSRNENRSSHGGVCLLQARQNKDGLRMGRKVNSNGNHKEIGEAFLLSGDHLARWEQIAKESR